MNDEEALKIFEDYFAGRASRPLFEQALTYFASAPAKTSRLVALYHALLEPGGISHETARAGMLRYLDPLTRREMSATERERFLLHLSRCADCAQEFLELRDFEQSTLQAEAELPLPRFKIPALKKKTASWPDALRPVLEKLTDTARQLKLALRFEPVPPHLVAGSIRETPANYHFEPEEFVLYSSGQEPHLLLNLRVTARRASPSAESCEVVVRLEGPDRTSTGQHLSLRYGDIRQEQTTDSAGNAIFSTIPIAALPSLQLILDINL